MPDDSAKADRGKLTQQIITHLVFVVFVVLIGLLVRPTLAWPLVLAGTVIWFLSVGHQTTGYFFGILIDSRNRISLSRAQMIVWSIVVLSAFAIAAFTNVSRGVLSPMAIGVPEEVWILLGISTTSLVGSPLLLNVKEDNPESDGVFEKPRGQASFSDMIKGEGDGNHAYVDLAKLQMGYFTIIVVLAYAVAVGDLFVTLAETAAVRELPGVDKGLLALMGISHTGYLASKPLRGNPKAGQDKPERVTKKKSATKKASHAKEEE